MSGESRRPLAARLGIVALNVLQPGLGLLRLGRFRAALACLLATPAVLVLLVAYYAVAPTLTLAVFLLCMGLVALVIIAALLGSMMLAWRWARPAAGEGSWWRRWYALAAAVAAGQGLAIILVGAAHSFYKPFYLPSEAMAPTLLKDDRLLASMRVPSRLRRGDVILFGVGGSTYIKRVAALPGDRLSLEGGVVRINGRDVPQRLAGIDRVDWPSSAGEGRRLSEQFPGEPAPHQIYDLGYTPQDDMAEQIVRPGHVFVLGDNRDHSADSRVSRQNFGVEQLPIADIRGVALFYTWGPSRRSGEPLTR